MAAAEVVAAPSASALEGLAVCLLDVSPEVQAARLTARGDDPSLLVHHQAFADDTSGLSRPAVADAVLAWCQSALAGQAPILQLVRGDRIPRA